MAWIFIYSGQVSRVRNLLTAIINLTVGEKLSLLLRVTAFRPLSLGTQPSRNSFSGRRLIKCLW